MADGSLGGRATTTNKTSYAVTVAKSESER